MIVDARYEIDQFAVVNIYSSVDYPTDQGVARVPISTRRNPVLPVDFAR